VISTSALTHCNNSSPLLEQHAIATLLFGQWSATASRSEPVNRDLTTITIAARMRWALMTSKFRLGVILASAFLAGCETRVEVVPISTSSSASKGASSQVMRFSEDSLNQKIIHRHNLGRLIRQDPGRALVELDAIVSR